MTAPIALAGNSIYPLPLEDGGVPGDIDDALGATVHSGTADVLATIVARWLGV